MSSATGIEDAEPSVTPDDILPQTELDRISREGHALYDARLRPLLEPRHNGEFVAIHLDSGDYAVAPSSSQARFALRARRSEGAILTTRVGPARGDQLAYRLLAAEHDAGRRK